MSQYLGALTLVVGDYDVAKAWYTEVLGFEAIEDVDMDDLHPESLWKFRIKGFGPLLVTMDSHGGSTYERIQGDAKAKRDAILAKLGAAE